MTTAGSLNNTAHVYIAVIGHQIEAVVALDKDFLIAAADRCYFLIQSRPLE